MKIKLKFEFEYLIVHFDYFWLNFCVLFCKLNQLNYFFLQLPIAVYEARSIADAVQRVAATDAVDTMESRNPAFARDFAGKVQRFGDGDDAGIIFRRVPVIIIWYENYNLNQKLLDFELLFM